VESALNAALERKIVELERVRDLFTSWDTTPYEWPFEVTPEPRTTCGNDDVPIVRMK